MRLPLLALLAIATVAPLEAQPSDSLRAALRTAPDTARARLLLGLARALEPDQPGDALRAALDAARLADDPDRLAQAHALLADLRLALRDPERARAHLDTADALARRTGDLARLARSANARSRTHAVEGDYPAALPALLRAVSLWERLDGRPGYDRSDHAAALINLGHVEGDLGDLDAALGRYRQALALARADGDGARAAAALMSVGTVYATRGEPARAAPYYRRALDEHRRVGNRRGAAFARANLAQALGELGRRADAVPLFRDAVADAQAVGDPALAAGLRAGYADALLDVGRPAEALAQAERALADARALDATRDEVRALESLAFASTALGRTADAVAYRARHGVLRDSLLGADRAAEAERLRAEFDADRRDQEIDRLQTRQALQAAVLDRQRLLTVAVALGLALALVAVGAVLWTGRLRRRAAVLDERTRIAREIHDTLFQGFTAVTLQAQAAADRIRADPHAAHAALASALDQADRVLVEARQSIWDRRSPALGGQTLPQALAGAVGRLAPPDGPPTVTVETDGVPRPLGDDVEGDLLRVATEAVANAVRHADAAQVSVRLAYGPAAVRLTVEDDGAGFDVDRVARTRAGHWGLLGIRERAARVGASLDVRSRPGHGTVVRLEIPSRRA